MINSQDRLSYFLAKTMDFLFSVVMIVTCSTRPLSVRMFPYCMLVKLHDCSVMYTGLLPFTHICLLSPCLFLPSFGNCWSLTLSVSLSVSLGQSLSLSLTPSLYLYLCVYLPTCLSCLFVCLSCFLSIFSPFISLTVSLSVSIPVSHLWLSFIFLKSKRSVFVCVFMYVYVCYILWIYEGDLAQRHILFP